MMTSLTLPPQRMPCIQAGLAVMARIWQILPENGAADSLWGRLPTCLIHWKNRIENVLDRLEACPTTGKVTAQRCVTGDPQMTLEKTIESFDSFEAADEATRRDNWAMTPEQRLEILEQLRQQIYPDAATSCRLQRVLESVEYTPR